MAKLSVVTQNFTSPNGFHDTPLMLLPRASTSLTDRDHEGFSQLFIQDRQRQRRSYIQSYTAFETSRKRQDFVLRQEGLRLLQNIEQRRAPRQEPPVHSYEQYFVKASRRAPVSPTPVDSILIKPYERHWKSRRSLVSLKHRQGFGSQHSAKVRPKVTSPTRFTSESEPFRSFTESYLERFTDSGLTQSQYSMSYNDLNDTQLSEEEQQQPLPAEPERRLHRSRTHEIRLPTPALQPLQSTLSSPNANTPPASPERAQNDTRHGDLPLMKDRPTHSIDPSYSTSRLTDKDEQVHQVLAFQESPRPLSRNSPRISAVRPNSSRDKRHSSIDSPRSPQSHSLAKTSDLLKKSMIVQNYASDASKPEPPSKIDRIPSAKHAHRSRRRKKSASQRHASAQAPSTHPRSQTSLADRDVPTVIASMRAVDLQGSLPEKPTIERPPRIAPVVDYRPEVKATNDTQVHAAVPELEPIHPQPSIQTSAVDRPNSMKYIIEYNRNLLRKPKLLVREKETPTKRIESESRDVEESPTTVKPASKGPRKPPGVTLGQLAISQQGCRFELPSDLTLLETLTPLDYLSRYCRLSPRRQFQFRQVFERYCKSQSRLDSTKLYSAIVDVYTDTFTRSRYDQLCQRVDFGNEPFQLAFDAFAGVLALCERILYQAEIVRRGLEQVEIAKDTIETCDFDCLDRKCDGLTLSEPMRNLLTLL